MYEVNGKKTHKYLTFKTVPTHLPPQKHYKGLLLTMNLMSQWFLVVRLK